jgi:adenosylhomocysteinase
LKIKDNYSRYSLFPELYENKVSTKLCKYYSNKHHNNKTELIIIHHLHEVAYEYINALSRSYPINTIIGIPYSSKEHIINKLQKKFNVIIPNTILEIPKIISDSIKKAKKKIIIQEIGAYSSKIINQLNCNDKVLGIVEDTSQGHWQWAKIKHISLPVISVAFSKIKRVEDFFVARSIIDATQKYLTIFKLGHLKNKKILVLGFGNLGKKLCTNLYALGYDFSVYDSDPIKKVEIVNEFTLSKKFNIFDCIIGVTGDTGHSLKDSDLSSLKNNVVLISGSSKNIEFDIDGFTNIADKKQHNLSLIKYTFGNKITYVANNGEPINLKYSVVPSKVLDFVYASLFFAINKISLNQAKKGLNSLSAEEESEIATDYIKIYL